MRAMKRYVHVHHAYTWLGEEDSLRTTARVLLNLKPPPSWPLLGAYLWVGQNSYRSYEVKEL